MPKKTPTRQRLTFNQDRKLFKYILLFSEKTLTFPTGDEMAKHLKTSVTRIYQLLAYMIEDGRVKKVDRYHFRLTAKGRIVK
jgi:Mn-dependent DtxR family transcriptional regulator